jgi:hypothetical protein
VSIGNILSQTGLGHPATVAGDTIPAQQATLSQLSNQISLVDSVFHLGTDPTNTTNFEPTGVFGTFLVDKLTSEGEYHFHFCAATAPESSGSRCIYTREILRCLHVDVGIDPTATTSTTTLTGPGTGAVLLTPRDRYTLGPGRSDTVTFSGGSPGTRRHRPDGRPGQRLVRHPRLLDRVRFRGRQYR